MSLYKINLMILMAVAATGCGDSVSSEDDGMPASADAGMEEEIPDDIPDDPATTSKSTPSGIYLLGVRNSVSEIRDYDFVDGYVLRTGWDRMETSEGTYNFESIDSFVEALDAIDQKLSLVVFSQKVPAYVLEDASVERYESFNQNNNGASYTTAVPWDDKALDRYELFVEALGDHLVHSLDAGEPVPLRDHPALNGIGAQIVGLGGLRDPRGVISGLPGYEREAFVQASVRSMEAVVSQFPAKSVHVAIFGISDETAEPALDDYVVEQFNTQFNSGSSPILGYFAENLACDTPGASAGTLLFAQKDTTYTMFQMLQAWQDPFQDADKTDECLTETGGPDVGIQYGFENFNTHYFEIYPIDLNHEPYWPVFQDWHDTIAESALSQ